MDRKATFFEVFGGEIDGRLLDSLARLGRAKATTNDVNVWCLVLADVELLAR